MMVTCGEYLAVKMHDENNQIVRHRWKLCIIIVLTSLFLYVLHTSAGKARTNIDGATKKNNFTKKARTNIEVVTNKNNYIKKFSFLVAGVQKSGTTALYWYLKEHPHLWLNRRKELHFFDDETIDWAEPDYTTYRPDDRGRSKSTLAGEATPIYIYWPNSMERIKRYNPNMKLIFIFRQPVERAWSHWKHENKYHHEHHSFSWAIRKGRARVTNSSETSDKRRYFSYIERGFYGQQLQKVLQLFPRQQLLLLRSEDLEVDPTHVIRIISEFLQVPAPKGKVKARRANVARGSGSTAVLDEGDATYLQNLYNDDLKVFAELSGLNISAWFH